MATERRGKMHVSKATRLWRELDGAIYLTITSDGTTGPQWIRRLEKQGFRLNQWAKELLNSQNFKPTSGVTTEIAILKGEMFSDDDRLSHKVRIKAEKRKLATPNAEIACLIREMFSDEEIEVMGISWIIVMHEPIRDPDGDLGLLATRKLGDGQCLRACDDFLEIEWDRRSGFAFIVLRQS